MIVVAIKVWVGLALLMFDLALVTPDPASIAAYKEFHRVHNPFVYWSGTLMTYTTAIFASVAFVWWVTR